MTQTLSPPTHPRPNDVFISYSRKDKDFVQRLYSAFRQENRDPWIDWEDIQDGEAWRGAIARGIEGADTFIFVISPASVASSECYKELDQAIRLNKRVIPIVWQEAATVHPVLAELNWIFFRDSDDFALAFGKLIKAISTDLRYVQSHTRYLSRAIEWEKGRDDSFLLRGKDLEAAETWLTQAASKEPAPTDLQQKYMHKSREVQDADDRLAARGRRANQVIRKSASIAMLSLLGSAVAIGTAIFQANQKIANLNTEITQKETWIQTLRVRQETLSQDRAVLIGELKKFGFTENGIEDLLTRPVEEQAQRLEQAQKANSSYHQTLDQLVSQQQQSGTEEKSSPAEAQTETPTESRPDSTQTESAQSSPVLRNSPKPLLQRSNPVTIEYYPKDVDSETVRKVFQKLGFNLDIKPALVTDIPINAIFYGQDVRAEDVKLVAFTLIRAGAQIRYIQPFRGDRATRKASIIQVGAERQFQSAPPLQVEQIQTRSLPLP